MWEAKKRSEVCLASMELGGIIGYSSTESPATGLEYKIFCCKSWKTITPGKPFCKSYTKSAVLGGGGEELRQITQILCNFFVCLFLLSRSNTGLEHSTLRSRPEPDQELGVLNWLSHRGSPCATPMKITGTQEMTWVFQTGRLPWLEAAWDRVKILKSNSVNAGFQLLRSCKWWGYSESVGWASEVAQATCGEQCRANPVLWGRTPGCILKRPLLLQQPSWRFFPFRRKVLIVFPFDQAKISNQYNFYIILTSFSYLPITCELTGAVETRLVAN